MPRLWWLSILFLLPVVASSCRESPPGEKVASETRDGDLIQARDSVLTLVSPGVERAPAGPQFLFELRDDVFGAVDQIDGEVVFINARGERLGAAALPDNFVVHEVRIGQQIVLVGDEASVRIPKDAHFDAQLALSPAVGPEAVERRGESLVLPYARGGLSRSLSLAPRSGGRVLTATFIGLDGDENAYAYWEEGSGREVAAWVGRFDPRDDLTTSVRLDLTGFVDMPALPVALRPSGQLLVMKPGAKFVQLVELTFPEGRAGPAETTPVGTAPSRVLEVGESFESIDDSRFELEELPRAPTRYDPQFGADALARARAYLDAAWTLSAANYEQVGIPNSCVPAQGKYWARPGRLTQSLVSKTVTAIPYKWGGFDTVDRFKANLNEASPALAGDVCTCRQAAYNNCLVPKAAGVDCSGFVSRAWGLASHVSTSGLSSVADRLPRLEDLRPADALNRPGSHVRLFVRFEPGPEVRLRTLESAVSCGGVCERVYTPAQLAKYRPMRRRP
jgi:hypothetical protein